MKQHTLNGLICIGLIALVFGLYSKMMSAAFISFDDAVYVTDNPMVNQGLSWDSLQSVLCFDRGRGPYWHPLTSVSHMIDCSLFGLDAGRHHLTNLMFHALNSVFLFLFLLRTTGARWKSAVVAVLFAIHPLNVETVAWISERKNLLAGCCFLGGLHVYLWNYRTKSAFSYGLLLLVFMAGLMSKPTMMTFPFTLLLIHHWPLNAYDFSGRSVRDFIETNKEVFFTVLPLILGMVVLFIMAVDRGQVGQQITSYEQIPLSLRLSAMLTADVTYLIQMVFPLNLTVFHPYPESVPVLWTLVCFTFLVAVSVYAMMKVRSYPYVFVGWFWYMGNLVTASGLMQQGYFPAYADRFTYLPLIGMFMLLAWGMQALSDRWRPSPKMFVVPVLVILAVAGMITFRQVGCWTNGIGLFRHAVTVNPHDAVSMTNLALALGEAGQLDEAMDVSQKALALEPGYAEALNNLGTLYTKKGLIRKSLAYFERALAVYPEFLEAKTNRHLALNILEKNQKAEDGLRKQLKERPESLETASALASVLIRQRKFDEADALYRSMLTNHPEAGVSITYNLACLHAGLGDTETALTWLASSLERGFKAWDHLDNDPDLKNIRKLGIYKDMVRQYRVGGP